MTSKEIIELLGKKISLTIDTENPLEVKGHLGELASLQASSSFACAITSKVVNQEFAKAIKTLTGTATDKKIEANSMIAEHIYWNELAEHYNKSLHYKIEAMRSILSQLKSEAQFSYTSNG